MFIPILLACSYFWSLSDFKNEVDIHVYQLNKEIEITHEEDLYNLGYLHGKLDVYKSFKASLDQIPLD